MSYKFSIAETIFKYYTLSDEQWEKCRQEYIKWYTQEPSDKDIAEIAGATYTPDNEDLGGSIDLYDEVEYVS